MGLSLWKRLLGIVVAEKLLTSVEREEKGCRKPRRRHTTEVSDRVPLDKGASSCSRCSKVKGLEVSEKDLDTQKAGNNLSCIIISYCNV